MNIKTASSEITKIIRNLVGLAILVIVVFILIIVTLHYEEDVFDKKNKIIYDYHLTLSEKSVSILNSINQTNLWFIKHQAGNVNTRNQEISPVKTALTIRDQIESLKYAIDDSMNDIMLLQKKYPIIEFRVIDSLVLKSYSDFNNSLKKLSHKDDINFESINAITAPLFATVRQYRLLHQIAYKRDRLLVRDIYYSNKSKVFLLLVVIIVIGIVGAVVILKHVSDALKQLYAVNSIVENALDFIGIASLEGMPLYLNHAGRELIGIRSDDENLRSDISDYFSDSDKDIFIKQIMPTVIDKGRWVGEIYFQHIITGALIPMWFDVFRIDDPVSGQPINIATVSRDLTELKNTQQELVASELRFSTILESTPSGVFQTDRDGQCIYINETYQSIVGIEFYDALGEGWANSIHPDDRENVFNEWGASVDEYRSFSMEYRILTPSGEVVWVFGQSNAERDIAGNIISYIGTITDITENKLILHELENYQEVLEEKVIDQTRSIRNALDIAERANKAKSEFLSHMSHELRTPLNAILGFAQMLKLDKEDFNEEQNENVIEILDAGHHLLSLINDVLDLAKIEAGKFSLSIESVMISDVVHESINFIVTQARKRNLTIFNNISALDSCVRADHLRLKQVLINLLSNAVKYNCDNGRITLDARVIDGDFLRVNIADTGRGLTKDDMSHVFDDFERLNQDDNVEGTGVGLVIVKNIIEIMGGEIGVKSELGFGTVFWFDIPLFIERK